MNLIPVVSSNVSAIGYENGVIEVHFHNGYAYRYPNRPCLFKRTRRNPYSLIPISTQWD